MPSHDNRNFTYQYRQPAEYHFCQDSVIMPRWVAEDLRDIAVGPEFRALDVCAGCGVIGLELAFHERRLKRIDFVEIQSEFRESFVENLAITGHDADQFRFLEMSYERLSEPGFAQAYDLVVGNPPYFLPDEGRRSGAALQDRCRFFLDSDPRTLVLSVIAALRPGGRAYLLFKSGVRHGRVFERELRLWLAGRAEIGVVAEIRGTALMRLMRPH